MGSGGIIRYFQRGGGGGGIWDLRSWSCCVVLREVNEGVPCFMNSS